MNEFRAGGQADRRTGGLARLPCAAAFDPAIMPSTGTPEPGGGQWNPAIRLLDRVFRERHVVGADVVELAPLPGMVAPDVLAAKLVYTLIGFHVRGLGR